MQNLAKNLCPLPAPSQFLVQMEEAVRGGRMSLLDDFVFLEA